jgi:hypothetical protein
MVDIHHKTYVIIKKVGRVNTCNVHHNHLKLMCKSNNGFDYKVKEKFSYPKVNGIGMIYPQYWISCNVKATFLGHARVKAHHGVCFFTIM